ncbi:hypothetical protein BC629DRAFT_1055295 [Irpex lacteus]|nr:hypothetical protein BC629DRAFT_1055295 [Irpex lacteus]
MKFARYLEDTQIPEWKRAYIDYRGLKKRITAIRVSQQNDDASTHNSLKPAPPVLNISQIETRTSTSGEPSQARSARSFLVEVAHEADEDTDARCDTPEPRSTHETDAVDDAAHADAQTCSKILLPQESSNPDEQAEQHGIIRSATLNMGFLPRLTRGKSSRGVFDLSRSVPLKDLIPALNPLQKAFFDKLDGELEKVETFYVEREKDMHARVSVLKGQLHELQEHRRVFHKKQINSGSTSDDPNSPQHVSTHPQSHPQNPKTKVPSLANGADTKEIQILRLCLAFPPAR